MRVSTSTVYTLDMPKTVYIQVQGVDKPAQIRADKVTKNGSGSDGLLILSNGDEQVGEFKAIVVNGWWIENEPNKNK